LTTKCTKFDFGGAPEPAVGALGALPNPLAELKGSYFYGKRRDGKGNEEGRGRKG